MERKVERFPIHPCITCITSPVINNTQQNVTCVTKDEATLTHNYSKFIVYLGFTLGIVHSMILDKYVMTYIQHYNILQSIFSALKILCFLLIYLCFLPTPLAITNLFIVSRISHFPCCHTVGIIQYWLLSFSNMHLSLLQVLLWLDSLFLFTVE